MISTYYGSGFSYDGGPYPADWFAFTVTREGPVFPARLAPGEKGGAIDDL